jgi:uncharacterized protein
MDEKRTHSGEAVVEVIPESVLESVDQLVAEAGGEWRMPAEYEGSIGRTMFDTPGSEDGTVTTLMPREHLDSLPMQSLVRIKSVSDGRSYLGAVVKGPFAEPDGLRADSPILTAVTVHGGIMLPKYHGRVQIGILGEELPEGDVVPPRRRPLPNSPVFSLDREETARVLRTGGDIRLGLMLSNEDIEVRVPSNHKAVFPRHLGILGTTGSGKSTTVSGLIYQLQKAGIAIVLLDTEGEYTAICDPTGDPQMKKALVRRGLEPSGVEDTTIYHLVGRDTANPGHPRRRIFSVSFSELSPHAVMEILELSTAQQERFLKAYDVTKLIFRQMGIFPRKNNKEDEDLVFELDELETGYPYMTLTHLYDVVKMILRKVAGESEVPYLENVQFRQNPETLKQIIAQSDIPSNTISWRALLGRLGRIKRLNIFDNPAAGPPPYQEILKPGHVAIIDLSDTDSPQINNLVIAQILRGIQRRQDLNYQEAIRQGNPITPAMIFIEEAHEFLSAKRINQMGVLFQQVARIARRGRKRWLGLAFITQLPQHLPDEVLGLINNWVLHKISDSNVVSRLRKSIGGIDDALWSWLTNLAPGQAIISFSNLARPLLTTIDPTPCRLLMVE